MSRANEAWRSCPKHQPLRKGGPRNVPRDPDPCGAATALRVFWIHSGTQGGPMRLILMRLILAFCALTAIGAAADEPLLLQKPTLSKTHIVFAYAGDLWSVPRDGGDAVRLTSGAGNETDRKSTR